ncbi:MAG: radical SAM protein [Candidatus Lokiarchaeota archaeon]|nr:radical SAM protein [Candidatus Lokiarchaeota archaeon]
MKVLKALMYFSRVVTLSIDISTEGSSVLVASDREFESYLETAFNTRRSNFGNTLYCYSPTSYQYQIDDHHINNSRNFLSLSVTGLACSLNCDHCQKKLLNGMIPTLSPDELIKRCIEVKKYNGEGVLISGGADSQGSVPLDRFGDAIRFVKTQLGLKVVVHTGILKESSVSMLADVGVDAVMLDVIANPDVSHRVYHLTDGPKRIRESLRLLDEYKVPSVPHVLIGLDYGKINGELDALTMISEFYPAGIVIIILNPVRGTPMANVTPPSPSVTGRILTIARLGFPKTPLLLGCARPIGHHKVKSDRYAIRAGVNGIAYISQEGVDFAREVGLKPNFKDICCSLSYQTISSD